MIEIKNLKKCSCNHKEIFYTDDKCPMCSLREINLKLADMLEYRDRNSFFTIINDKNLEVENDFLKKELEKKLQFIKKLKNENEMLIRNLIRIKELGY